MKIWTRVLILLAVALLGLTFRFALWRFELWAPQYPEGLSMEVWTHKLSGSVRNINLLNHYVGMKPIEAEDFWELRYFPYILGIFILTGLLAALANWRRLAMLWAVALLIFGVVGLCDFYYWEYNFGHDLSDDAPIKMEGMVYQPPFIGTSTMLNITATSIPAIGGIGLSAAVILAGLVGLSLLQGCGLKKKSTGSLITSLLILGFFLLAAVSGCESNEIEPLLFGQDECHGCKMTITDQRYGAEVRTKGGKIYKFDSLDCMLPYYRQNQETISEVWVVDSFAKGNLIKVKEAKFVYVSGTRSPMGIGVLASKNITALTEAGKGAPVLDWQAAQELYSGKT